MIVALPQEPWPIFDAATERSQVYVVEGLVIGPCCLGVVDLELDIRGDPREATSVLDRHRQ